MNTLNSVSKNSGAKQKLFFWMDRKEDKSCCGTRFQEFAHSVNSTQNRQVESCHNDVRRQSARLGK